MNYPRTLSPHLLRLRSKYPILAITGPRQSGKTTLLRTLFSDYRYVSLENAEVRQFAENDPNGFLRQYNERVIFDEVQRVPGLFSYLQTKTDEDKQMGQYILSGSQNFSLMHSITQSLAGRVALFRLFPFSFSELVTQKSLADDFQTALFTGFYPALFDRQIAPNDYYPDYIETYLERDVRNLINLKDLSLFRTFVRLCAGRIGQLLNVQSLASDCGINSHLAKVWLTLLESSYLVFLLPPYYENFNKRLMKSPKLYFYDTGLACSLLGIKSAEQVETYYQKGALFENLVVANHVKNQAHQHQRDSNWFWRDSNQNEIDLIRENNNRLDLVEIKAGQTVAADFFKGISYFEKLNPERIGNKVVVYGGKQPQFRSQATVLGWQEDFTETVKQ